LLVACFLPECGKKKQTTVDPEKSYALFKEGSIPAPSKRIVPHIRNQKPIKPVVEEVKEEKKEIPELDFEVQNATAKTLYITCFSYIQKEEFARWRWDKSHVYKLESMATVFVNVDTIPDDENREDIFGYLAIFENEQEAQDSIYELVDDNNKIDLDRINKLHNKKVVIDVEKYGFKKTRLDFAIIEKLKKKLPPEIDFVVENQTGKTIFVAGFIYQIKDDIRSVWTYAKTPVLKLEPEKTGIIDIDSIYESRDRLYMSGFLGVFEEHEEQKARDATYELLPPKNKIAIGRLSRLKNQKVIIEIERYGAVGELTEFATKPTVSPLTKIKEIDYEPVSIQLKNETTPTSTDPPSGHGLYQLFG